MIDTWRGTYMARNAFPMPRRLTVQLEIRSLTCGYGLERAKGIEPS